MSEIPAIPELKEIPAIPEIPVIPEIPKIPKKYTNNKNHLNTNICYKQLPATIQFFKCIVKNLSMTKATSYHPI